MKLIETNKWCISADGEFFSDVYDSKEEAIESIKDNYEYDGGYIGRCVDIRFVEQDILDFEISYMLRYLLYEKNSCMKVSSTIPLPEKDFKAVVKDGEVKAVGIEFFDSAMEAQALYKLNKEDWQIWLDKIIEYCENDKRKCYAEAALNEVTDECHIKAFDVRDRLCTEIDNPEDLEKVKKRITEII